MKKLILVLTAALLPAFLLSACGNSEEEKVKEICKKGQQRCEEANNKNPIDAIDICAKGMNECLDAASKAGIDITK